MYLVGFRVRRVRLVPFPSFCPGRFLTRASGSSEEDWMQSAPFHNGYGLMTVQGVRKPGWRAFELLHGAGDTRLPVGGFVSPADGDSTISVLATTGTSTSTDGSTVQLYVANYHRLSSVTRFACDKVKKQCAPATDGPYTDHSLCNAECGSVDYAAGERPASRADNPDCPAQNVTLILVHDAGATLPSALTTVYRIDDANSAPMAAWERMGSPSYPNATEIAAMDDASQLKLSSPIPVTKINETASSISFHMPSYSVLYIAF